MLPKNHFRAITMLLSATFGSMAMPACSGNAMSRQIAQERAVARDVSEAARLMTGAFTSHEQSVRDLEYRDIQLHVTAIWPDLSSESQRWLYVEQAAAESLDKPYRQRIYRLTQGSLPSQVVSEVFELPGGATGAARYAGMWRTPEAFTLLNPPQLKRREGCAVYLRRIGPGVFEGETAGSSCWSSLQGAEYATSQVLLNRSGLMSWDRGFDAAGKQVWGAVKGPYEFKRISQ